MRKATWLLALVVGCGSAEVASSGADGGADGNASAGGDATTADGAAVGDAAPDDSAIDGASDAGIIPCTPTSWTTSPLEALGDAPSLAVDALGGIHVAFVTGSQGDVVYGHRPPGGTWTKDVLSSGEARNTATAIAVDAALGVHVVYETTGSGTATRYAHKPANGAWTKELVHSPYSTVGKFSIALDSAGKPHLGIQFSGTTQFEVTHTEQAAGGGWGTHVVEAITPGAEVRIAIDDAGVRVAYPVTNSNIRYAQSTPDGGWSIAPVVGNPNKVSLALDPSGDPHLAFDTYAGGVGYLTHAVRAGGAWVPETAGSAGSAPGTCSINCAIQYNALAIDRAGGIHASFTEVDFLPPGPRARQAILRYAYRAPGGTWASEVINAPTVAVGYLGMINALAVEPNGGVHVVYTASDDANTPRKLMYGYRCH